MRCSERRAMLLVILVAQLALRCSAAAGAPKALSIPPDQYWDGNDGPWSTFGMQVGSPPQGMRLLPATGEGSVWVVHPQGCTSKDPADCGDNRGTLFFNNRTSSWVEKGTYGLYLSEEKKLGYSGSGLYGWDTVQLGWPGDGAPAGLPIVQHQVVAEIATKDFYMGAWPLNPWPVNFTDITQSTPSLLSSLRNSSKIPSLSWGYTAGMVNHKPPIFGSLTLGGYDTKRFTETSRLEFAMGSDISRDLQVAVQRVTSSTTSTSLLSDPIFALINSLVPHIWLPVDACQAFEKAFNLTLDPESNLYVVDNDLHQSLVQQNPTVTFEIGPATSGDNVKIEMPYGSFDLNASFPLVKPVGNSTRYFPLRRADNDTQYTLGRAFLQNAYVIANYENFTFSVSPARYPSTAEGQNLVTIPGRGSGSKFGLSIGVIVGIAIAGAFVGITAVFLIRWFFIRKHKSKKNRLYIRMEPPVDPMSRYGKQELDTTGHDILEAGGQPVGHELDSANSRGYELDSKNPIELPVNEVAASEFYTPTSTPFETTPSITPTTTPAPQVQQQPQRNWETRIFPPRRS